MADWPATLPQVPRRSPYEEIWPDNVIRSPMEVGPPQERRRSTVARDQFVLSMDLTSAQLTTLRTFYRTTCADGTIKFSWEHPRTGAAMDFKFRGGPPRIAGDGDQAEFMVTFTVEEAP